MGPRTWRSRPLWLVVILLVIAVVGGSVFYTRSLTHETAIPPVAAEASDQALPTVNVMNRLKADDFPSPPAEPVPAGCHRPPLPQAKGPWVTDYADNQDKADVLPKLGTNVSLYDFFWRRTMASPDYIGLQADGARDLNAVLQKAQEVNPCAWRLFTFIDEPAIPAEEGAFTLILERILFNPEDRLAHLHALADELARHPLADGITIDYEKTLPGSAEQLRWFKRADFTNHPEATDEVMLQSLQNNFSELIREIAWVVHLQHRVLRVAVAIKTDDSLHTGYPRPSVQDYGAIGASADAVTGMAYDIAYNSRANPGPIAPFKAADHNDVSTFLQFAVSVPQLKNKLTIGEPVYGYDWPVNQAGINPDPQHHPATDFTASQLVPQPAGTAPDQARSFSYTDSAGTTHQVTRTGDQDGEIRFEYDDDAKQHHVAWFAGYGLPAKSALYAQLCSWCGLATWSAGNADPAGANNIAAAYHP
jgi:hypothetical protein